MGEGFWDILGMHGGMFRGDDSGGWGDPGGSFREADSGGKLREGNSVVKLQGWKGGNIQGKIKRGIQGKTSPTWILH